MLRELRIRGKLRCHTRRRNAWGTKVTPSKPGWHDMICRCPYFAIPIRSAGEARDEQDQPSRTGVGLAENQLRCDCLWWRARESSPRSDSYCSTKRAFWAARRSATGLRSWAKTETARATRKNRGPERSHNACRAPEGKLVARGRLRRAPAKNVRSG